MTTVAGNDVAPAPVSVPLSIALLAHNEADTIEDELASLHAEVIGRLPGSELVVAEDGSTDGTAQIIEKLAARMPLVHVSSKSRRGYARAFADAVMACRGEWILFSDTGKKFDPAEAWKLYAQKDRFDLVLGRRTLRRDPAYRRLLTVSYNALLRAYFGIEVSDADSGFRLFNRKVVDSVVRPGLRFRGFVGSEIVLRTIFAGLRYVEVPVSYGVRVGVSRGMPARTIPGHVLRVLSDMGALKRERQRLHAEHA